MKFALALIATTVAAGNGRFNFGYDDEPSYLDNARSFGSPQRGYGYQAPEQSYGYSNDGYQPTYANDEHEGYGIYSRAYTPKRLIANDGYRVKKRSDPYERLYETVNAKCVLEDPEEESYVRGVISLSQGAKDTETKIWGEIWGVRGEAEFSINALGDLRDGCESAGDIFNPDVSASGYGYGYEETPARGILNSVGANYHGASNVEQSADVDLSGTQSIIGRSMVLTAKGYVNEYGQGRPDVRVACCTIGLSAGPKRAAYQPEPEYNSYSAPSYRPSYQPASYNDYEDDYSNDYSLGYQQY